MENEITWEYVDDDLKQLVEIGLYTKEELIERLYKIKKGEYNSKYEESVYKEPVYATKSSMTKKEAEFLFEHQGERMNAWRLEMLLENGYELEANDKWNKFIKDLLDQKEITKRQYDNWKDRFIN